MRFSYTLFLSLLILTACSGDVLPPLPSGEQTVTGVLQSAELSAVRRGSFVLEQEGVDVYYAESSLVNLREYEGKLVTLRGVLEHNTSPEDLAVLVVESVVDVEETQKEHTFPQLRLQLSAPTHWKRVSREGKWQFRLEEDSEDDPLLVLWQTSDSTLPDGGVPVVIDATRATKLVDDISGTQIIAVQREESILMLRFSPGARFHADRLHEEFIALLSSVELLEDRDTEVSEPSFGTGSLGKPCGGSAGVLCPEGFFCDVQSFEDNVGKCRKL